MGIESYWHVLKITLSHEIKYDPNNDNRYDADENNDNSIIIMIMVG